MSKSVRAIPGKQAGRCHCGSSVMRQYTIPPAAAHLHATTQLRIKVQTGNEIGLLLHCVSKKPRPLLYFQILANIIIIFGRHNLQRVSNFQMHTIKIFMLYCTLITLNYNCHHSACIKIGANDVIIIWVLPKKFPGEKL